MKKFSIFIFLLSQWFFYAQNDLDTMLSNINQTSVTSGIIYERTLPIANLYEHNQQGLNFNKTDYKLFKQALLELYRASNYTKLISLSELENRIANEQNLDHVVNIGIINTPFHILNYNAENPSQGGLTLNSSTNKFSQIAGKPAFYELYACLVAPLKEIVKGNTLTFKFSNSLILNNGTNTIKQMTVNFGDGVNRIVINNYALVLPTVNITNNFVNGHRNITFNLTFNDNKTLTTYGSIYTYKPPTGLTHKNTSCIGLPLKDDIYYRQIGPHENKFESDFTWGNPPIKPEIQARVYYRTNNGNTLRQITKPIIIVDGFDPGDRRKFEDCDCASDPNCAKNYTVGTSFIADKHKSMIDAMDYKKNGLTVNMIDTLRKGGFDVILVNHPTYDKNNVKIDGGADYIERNAMALATLIKYVNVKLQQNGSNEQLSIIGPSMGGQISKFALAWMEKKYAETNEPQYIHNTRLWVSFDSTHHGANVPMGAQALLNFLKDQSNDARKFYEEELGSVASKQQLIEYHQAPQDGWYFDFTSGTLKPKYNNEVVIQSNLNAQTIAQGFSANTGNPFYIEHYTNQYNNGLPNSKGYPQNVRRVGITNGSLSGLSSGSNSEIALDLRGFQRVCIKPFSWFGFGGGPSHCFTLKLVEMEQKFMAGTGGTNNVVRFRKMMQSSQNTWCPNINSRGNMDIVPGGLFPTQHEIASSILPTESVYPWLNQLGSYLNTIISGGLFGNVGGLLGALGNFPNRDRQWFEQRDPYKPFNSFVPTFSSIAHKNPNQNWNNRLDRNLVCTNETYFHSYFGGSQNTEHVVLNIVDDKLVDWLLKELNGVDQSPWFPLEENVLGYIDNYYQEYICLNTNFNLSISEPCRFPSAVTWEVSNNLQVLSSSDYSINVLGVSNGLGFIKLKFGSGQEIIKELWVGVPPTPIIDAEATTINAGYISRMEVSNSFGSDSFEWNLPLGSSSGWWSYHDYPSPIFTEQNWIWIRPNVGGLSGYLECRASNDCGFSDFGEIFVTSVNNGSGGGSDKAINTSSYYKIYPNPSNSIINIDLRDSKNEPLKSSTISGTIYDLMGQSRIQVDFIENKATANVSNLQKGVYVLKIYIDGVIESHQVIVQ